MGYDGHVASKRNYDDGCAMAQALNLVGERWALLVVRELVLGPKRFTDLRKDMPGISSNVLSQRLDELEQAGVVQRRRLAPPANAWVYELTDWGHDLEPIIGHLGRWGARSPHLARGASLSVNSFVLSLRNMFDPAAADGVDVSIQLRLGDHHFHAEVADNAIEVSPGDATAPAATLESDPNILAAVFYDSLDLAEAVKAGDVSIEGDDQAVARFLTLFHLPEPAPLG